MDVTGRWQHIIAWLRGFTYGAARSWVMAPMRMQQHATMEQLFMALILSEQEGVPLAPADLRLRLLPYLVPQILYWKRRYRLWDEDLELAHIEHLGH